jgi:hypothetical protein
MAALWLDFWSRYGPLDTRAIRFGSAECLPHFKNAIQVPIYVLGFDV